MTVSSARDVTPAILWWGVISVQDKRAGGRGDANRGASLRRAGRRQAGRTRGHARGRHLLHTRAFAGLHHTHHCGRPEHGGEGRLLAEER